MESWPAIRRSDDRERRYCFGYAHNASLYPCHECSHFLVRRCAYDPPHPRIIWYNCKNIKQNEFRVGQVYRLARVAREKKMRECAETFTHCWVPNSALRWSHARDSRAWFAGVVVQHYYRRAQRRQAHFDLPMVKRLRVHCIKCQIIAESVWELRRSVDERTNGPYIQL